MKINLPGLIFLPVIFLFSSPILSESRTSGNPLTLKSSLELALAANPKIISARSRTGEARSQLGEAYALLLPTLKAEYTLTRNFSDPTIIHLSGLPGFGQDILVGYSAPYNVYRTGLNLTEYFFTGQTMPAILMAQNNLKSARANERQAANEVAMEVASDYYNCLKALDFFQLADETLVTAREHLKQVRVMMESGVATRADLLQAEVRASEAELNVISAENSVVLAKYSFNNSLGRPLETPVILEKINYLEETGRLKLEKIVTSGLLKSALEKRPDWLALVYQQAAARHAVGLAAGGYWPVLFGNFSYNWQNSILPEGQWNYVRSWAGLLGISINLFDGGATPAKVLRAKSALEDVNARLEDARRGVELEIKESLQNLDSSLKKFQVCKKSSLLAAENMRIAFLRFQAQAGTELEVLSAETNLTQARTVLIQSAFDYLLAGMKLKKAIGEDLTIL